MEQRQQGHPALWGHGAPWGQPAPPPQALRHRPWQEGPTAGRAAGSAAGIYRAARPPRLPATWPQVKGHKHFAPGCCPRYGHTHGVSLCRHPRGSGACAAQARFHGPIPPELHLQNFTTPSASLSPHPGSKGRSGARGPVCPPPSVPPPRRSPKGRAAQRPPRPQTAPLRSAALPRSTAASPGGPERRAARSAGAARPGSGQPSNAVNHSAAASRCPGPAGRCEQVRIAAGVYAGSCSSSATGTRRCGRGHPRQTTPPARPPLRRQPGCSHRGHRAPLSGAPLPRVFLPHAQRRSPPRGRTQPTDGLTRRPHPHEPPTTPSPIGCHRTAPRRAPPAAGPAPRRRPGRPAPLLRPRRHVTARSADRVRPAHAHGEK